LSDRRFGGFLGYTCFFSGYEIFQLIDLWILRQIADINLFYTVQLHTSGQLSLLHSAGWEINTDQSAMMLCNAAGQ